jgi:hypothetical protein
MNPTTQARIDRIMAIARLCVRTGAEEPLREAIESALKFQDRDTRHACAEAVCTLRADGRLIDCERAALVAAESACMNARGAI